MKKNINVDIHHIARLVNVALTNEEIKRFTPQLSAILDFVSKLQKLPTKSVSPTTQVNDLDNVFREDKIDEENMLSQKEALANAPETHQGFFQVKAVFEEE